MLKKHIFIILLFIGLLLGNTHYAYAGCSITGYNSQADCRKAGGTWREVPSTQGGAVTLTNPLTGEATTKDINVLIGQVINAVLGVVGSLALIMFIYGGFVWMLAAGNNERVQKGKNVLVWATVGLVVIFSAYAIVLFVFQGLDVPGATTTTTP